MLCECGKHEATIHEVIITSDKRKVERHLCELCAREQGVSSDPYIPIDQLISATNYIMGQALTQVPEADAESEPAQEPTEYASAKDHTTSQRASTPTSCVGCGLSYAHFKKHGLLGCPACYQTFTDRLGPMIERAHEGACNHVGKVPQRALKSCRTAGDQSQIETLLGDVRQREERLESLRQRLAKSINAEEYERAAMLRDELTRLTTLASSQIEPNPSASIPNLDLGS
jgi:protein arginine kinase activator